MTWQPIETAPRDGTSFEALIEGEIEPRIIAYQSQGFYGADGIKELGGWCIHPDDLLDAIPPKGWDDGVCWQSNSNDEPSAKPTHWRPLLEAL